MSTRKNYIGRVIGSFLIILVASGTQLSAYAEDVKGRTAVGFKVGLSKLTQDFEDYNDFEDVYGTEGDIGPILGGSILYNLNNMIAAGFEIEWETHNIDYINTDLGDIDTVSLIPFLQIRYPDLKALSPYGKIGLGVNINSVSMSNYIKRTCSTCSDIEADNTFAFKVAGGIDYFINSYLSLNSEIGWKLNSGEEIFLNSCRNCRNTTVDFSASAFTWVLGVRYYFK